MEISSGADIDRVHFPACESCEQIFPILSTSFDPFFRSFCGVYTTALSSCSGADKADASRAAGLADARVVGLADARGVSWADAVVSGMYFRLNSGYSRSHLA